MGVIGRSYTPYITVFLGQICIVSGWVLPFHISRTIFFKKVENRSNRPVSAHIFISIHNIDQLISSYSNRSTIPHSKRSIKK